MKHRNFAASMALSLSMLAVPAVLHAAPPSAKPKLTSVHMRNETAMPVTVQAGDQQITLKPGKEATVKVAQGTQLTAVNQTPNHTAGSVIGTAGTLEGSTLVID